MFRTARKDLSWPILAASRHPLPSLTAPSSFELFLLSEGEKRIEENVYSGEPPRAPIGPAFSPSSLGMSNTSDFTLNKEDHTLGNLLSEHLKLHPNVYMAGYKRTYQGKLLVPF